MPYFAQKYAGILKACFATVARPSTLPFTLVLAIGKNGDVLKIYNDTATNIYTCMKKDLDAEVFPAPPTSPFFMHIKWRFTD